MIHAIVKRCAGIDVHKSSVTCTILVETPDGSIDKETRSYRTFRAELSQLAQWMVDREIELVAMESTGIYWKALYEILESSSVNLVVVNASHVKHLPGRKTDVTDSEWLAELARCGLLRASFIPPKDLREIRLLTRYRRKIVGTHASQKNRLHKLLEDGGIRLGSVVSKLDGKSSRDMIDALIRGDQIPERIVKLARGRLKKKSRELQLALDGQLSDRHRFVLKKIRSHMDYLETELDELNRQIVAAMEPYKEEWKLLQTMPGIDKMSAAVLLAEIGTDMSVFGSQQRFCKWLGVCPGNNESAGKKKADEAPKATTSSKQQPAK